LGKKGNGIRRSRSLAVRGRVTYQRNRELCSRKRQYETAMAVTGGLFKGNRKRWIVEPECAKTVGLWEEGRPKGRKGSNENPIRA